MKKLALILLLLTLTACTHTISPVCRHNAMYAAVTACETMPVRMAVGGKQPAAQCTLKHRFTMWAGGGTWTM